MAVRTRDSHRLAGLIFRGGWRTIYAMANRPSFNTSAGFPDSAFFDRIRSGDLSTVRQILADRPAATHWQQVQNGQSCLHVAAMANQVRIAAELVKAGADIEARDHLGRTPLLQAARSGQAAIIDFLVKRHADMNAADKKGNTALHLAAQGINADTIIALMARGANSVRLNHDGGTPVDVALATGNQAMAAVIRREAGKQQHVLPAAPPEKADLAQTQRDITPLKPMNLHRRPGGGR